MNLPALARAVREHPGLRGKRELAAWSRPRSAATATTRPLLADGDGPLALAAEAIHPPFVAAQPRAAGVAGVVTVAQRPRRHRRPPPGAARLPRRGRRGASPRSVLEGLRIGAALYRVPVLGGHATVEDGRARRRSPPSRVGRARAPLSARNARAGRRAWRSPPASRAR